MGRHISMMKRFLERGDDTAFINGKLLVFHTDATAGMLIS
jgi:hypothetical protein